MVDEQVKRDFYERFETLDVCVVKGLEYLKGREVSPFPDVSFKRPLVIGSGNALLTGKILFSNYDSVYANESSYLQKLHVSNVDGIVIVSASGGKDASKIARWLSCDARSNDLEIMLLTNNPNPLAAEFIDPDNIFVFDRRAEPYTYNFSTYFSMIRSKTKEDIGKIQDELAKLLERVPENLGREKYGSYTFIVPEGLSEVGNMFVTKFDEMFVPKIFGQVFTLGELRHAKTIIPDRKRLFVNFDDNEEVKKFVSEENGHSRFDVRPINLGSCFTMALGYFFIGQIQKSNPNWFRNNLLRYTDQISEAFGQQIKPIVE